MTITMYDSITPSAVPKDAQAVAGYVGGSWPDYSQLVQMFPHALHLSIAVNASEDGDILDVENGDAVPSQAPGWVRRQLARGHAKPGVYSSLSEWPAVDAALRSAGIDPHSIKRWAAQWTFAPHIPTGFDGCQWTDHGPHGENYDISDCYITLFGNPAPPVNNKVHYDWFPSKKFVIFGKLLSERAVVQRYDKLRATQTKTNHPHRIELALLRQYLGWLAGRVYTVSHKQKLPSGKPSWKLFHRGWRYQNLVHRSNGQRFV